MTIAVLAVSGAMLFGMGKPAQSQEEALGSNPEPPCGQQFCLDKTADLTDDTATVGEPITFTITQRCPGIEPPRGCIDFNAIVDTLPSDAGLTDVSVPAGCTLSGNTVTCPGSRFTSVAAPFTITIVATPTECGTFTNTASRPTATEPFTATYTFTVVRCPPPMKDDCKKGGWEEFGFPDQGTCVSAWNRQNRQ
jgi:hypothetical protein